LPSGINESISELRCRISIVISSHKKHYLHVTMVMHWRMLNKHYWFVIY